MQDMTVFDYDEKISLAVEVLATHQRDGVVVEDLTYASPRGGKVPAYLIRPQGSGPFAGLIFVHWSEGDREEFVFELMTKEVDHAYPGNRASRAA